jgi:tRNA-dihydrouridine synthase
MIGRGALRNPWIFSEIRENQTITISRETLIHALGVYVLLHELDTSAPERLHACAREIFSAPPCGRSEAQWSRTFALLAKTLTEGGSHGLGHEGEWPSIELRRNTLGRAKMLWNYMRSALPDRMFEPQILRAKNLSDLLVAIHRTAGLEGDQGMAFKYRPDIDWLYAGGRDSADQTMDRFI